MTIETITKFILIWLALGVTGDVVAMLTLWRKDNLRYASRYIGLMETIKDTPIRVHVCILVFWPTVLSVLDDIRKIKIHH